MADDAVIRLGYDNSKVRAGAMETQAIMSKTAKGVEASMTKAGAVVSKGGKGGGMGFAGVGMQIQDIAVQMQMGTKAATIFAQQGSQMASAFGPAGVAIGATIAVVGGLYTAGDKSNEMFEAMIKNVGDLKSEADKIISTGSLSEITAQTTKLADASKELQKSSDALATMGGAFAPVAGMALGGDSPQERMNKLAKAASALEFKRGQLAIAAIETSEQEVELMRLKASGNEDAAEAMERELALKRKIAAIENQPFTDRTKKRLIANETEKSRLQGDQKANQRAMKDEEEGAAFMKDFRFRRAVLREKGQAEKAQEIGMSSAFDGKRRKIRGYTGGSKSGERLGSSGGYTGKSFNEFFHPEETQFGQLSSKGGSEQTFDEFFNPRGKKSATKSSSTTNTRIREGGAKPEESLLKRIADGIESLAAN